MLLQATASTTINTALQTSQDDIVRDFTPVGLATASPFVLLVNPNVPAKTVGELIAYAKANPGKLNYASSGVGTPPHLAGELFRFRAGIDIVHVPYREANAALASVITGATQMTFALVSIAVAQVNADTWSPGAQGDVAARIVAFRARDAGDRRGRRARLRRRPAGTATWGRRSCPHRWWPSSTRRS